jgi:hypothetical protein
MHCLIQKNTTTEKNNKTEKTQWRCPATFSIAISLMCRYKIQAYAIPQIVKKIQVV